jgi:hypothetical protein
MVSAIIGDTLFDINACRKGTREGKLGASFSANVKRITKGRSPQQRDALAHFKPDGGEPECIVNGQSHFTNNEKHIPRRSIERAPLLKL